MYVLSVLPTKRKSAGIFDVVRVVALVTVEIAARSKLRQVAGAKQSQCLAEFPAGKVEVARREPFVRVARFVEPQIPVAPMHVNEPDVVIAVQCGSLIFV